MRKKIQGLGALALMASLLQGMPVMAADAQGEVIVVDAKNGSDSNAGSAAAPVKSLKKAQELVRAKNQNMKADLTVEIKEGTYTLDEPLKFDSSDSATNGFTITWKAADGEKAVISGGAAIEGWTETEAGSGIYKANAKGIESRDLYVNGTRAQIAKQDVSAYQFKKKYIYLNGEGLPESIEKTQDLEFVFAKKWKCCIGRVDTYIVYEDDVPNGRRIKLDPVTYDQQKINLTGAAIDDAGMAEAVRSIQNAIELLDEPGEWYLDKEEDTIYYMPKEGEDLSKASTVLGVQENLMTLEGEAGKPVSGLSFKNLEFTESTWNKPSHNDGLQTFQASAIVRYDDEWNREWIPSDNAAVYGIYTQGIEFDGCTFDNLGNAAINLSRSTKDASITANTFTRLGGSAILLGGVEIADHLPEPADLTVNNLIQNNLVDGVSQTYKGCTGIQVGFARSTTIDHNTVKNLPYTGISCGWGWGYNDFNANTYFRIGRNAITNNLIQDVLTEKTLIDGGGIYTLGRQDDSIIHNNYVDGVHNEYGGIYLDEGSVGFDITNNVVKNCVRNWLYKGDYNEIYNNYAGEAKEPNRDETLPIKEGADLHYRFENNDLKDEAAEAAILDNAGVKIEEPVTAIVMYRLYNPNSGEHFYTSSENEANFLVSQGWKHEGEGWTAPSRSGVPVYRLYNENAGDHHYTADEKERDGLVKLGWKDEGIGWYSCPEKKVPLYRLYNPNAKAGSHHYTSSLEEYIYLAGQGWKQETIGWYGIE